MVTHTAKTDLKHLDFILLKTTKSKSCIITSSSWIMLECPFLTNSDIKPTINPIPKVRQQVYNKSGLNDDLCYVSALRDALSRALLCQL